MSKNDLTMAYAVNGRPRGVSVLDALRVMRSSLDEGGELPDGYDVTWKWRNTAKQDMRETDFTDAVTASRKSFSTLMARRLDRDIQRLEYQAIEEAPRRRPARSRSAAAKRGWITRRARIAERSGRSRKGWATRRVRAARKRPRVKRKKGRK